VVDFRRQAVTKLLINEPPLQVLPTLAGIVGLNEAIVIQQLHYLSNFPNFGVVINGNRWIYFTYKQWREEYFPFWSVRTIQRTFQNLEENNYVIAAQLDKKSHDMRKYYRLNYYQIGTIEGAKMALSEGAKLAHSLKGNTETTTETTLREKKRKKSMPKGVKNLELKFRDMLKQSGRGKGSATLARQMSQVADEYLTEAQNMNGAWNAAHAFPQELESVVKKFERGFGISLMRDEAAAEIYRWIAEQKPVDIDKFIAWATAAERVQYIGKYRKSPGLIKAEWKLAFPKSTSESRVGLLETLPDDDADA